VPHLVRGNQRPGAAPEEVGGHAVEVILINLALAVLPTLLRLVSKLATAMAQAIEQLKQASATSTGAGTVVSSVGQAPSEGASASKEFKQGEEPGCLDCMRDKDFCPDCTDGDLYVSPDAGEGYGR